MEVFAKNFHLDFLEHGEKKLPNQFLVDCETNQILYYHLNGEEMTCVDLTNTGFYVTQTLWHMYMMLFF